MGPGCDFAAAGEIKAHLRDSVCSVGVLFCIIFGYVE